MHHKTDIKPVIENCTTSFYREMKESISEHYFHILWYIFDSNFNIHKQHYLYDISSDVYSKEKGIPALSRLTKQRTCQEYVLYQVWSLQFNNWQEWGVFKKCNKKQKKKAPESINLQFAVESATFHLFTCQIKAIIPSSNVIYKIIHGSNLNTQLITEYSNCFMSFQTLIIF